MPEGIRYLSPPINPPIEVGWMVFLFSGKHCSDMIILPTGGCVTGVNRIKGGSGARRIVTIGASSVNKVGCEGGHVGVSLDLLF